MSITFSPDKQVTITAPLNASLEKVLQKIGTRAAWISKQFRKFDSYQNILIPGRIEKL